MAEGGEDNSLTELQTRIRLQYDRLTKMKKKLTNFLKDSESRKTKTYFNKRLEVIEELHHEFGQEDRAILCSEADPSEAYFQNDISDAFEMAYLQVFCSISEARDIAFPPAAAIVPVIQPPNERPADAIRRTNVQVPNMTVPKFSGKIIDWPGFYDNFNRMFHLNPDLNAMQRFHFLKEALPEEKDMDIRHMAMTEAN